MTYLMHPLTSESGLKVLEGEKGTGRRKTPVRKRESLLLCQVSCSVGMKQ